MAPSAPPADARSKPKDVPEADCARVSPRLGGASLRGAEDRVSYCWQTPLPFTGGPPPAPGGMSLWLPRHACSPMQAPLPILPVFRPQDRVPIHAPRIGYHPEMPDDLTRRRHLLATALVGALLPQG